jgi:hypothetical protein
MSLKDFSKKRHLCPADVLLTDEREESPKQVGKRQAI